MTTRHTRFTLPAAQPHATKTPRWASRSATVQRKALAPHPATVVPSKTVLANPRARPPHTATAALLPVVKARPPHAAMWVQDRAALTTTAQRMEQPIPQVVVEKSDRGWVATVSNAKSAEYFVPFLPNKGLDVPRLRTDIELKLREPSFPSRDLFAQTHQVLGELSSQREGRVRPKDFADAMTLKYGDEWDKPLLQYDSTYEGGRAARKDLGPLYTIEGWRKYYEHKYEFKVMINANWFYIRTISGFPHLSPLTHVQGLAVSKGRAFSHTDMLADHVAPADSLVVLKELDSMGRRIRIMKADELRGIPLESIKWAVSGFKILHQAQYVLNETKAFKMNGACRSAVGLNQDGDTLIFAVVVNTETDKTLAELLKTKGAYEAINLDNSNSSQMWVKDQGAYVPGQDTKTFASNAKAARPVPCFFAVVDKKIPKK